jgi:molybdenum cofactor cytidylyltransferase
MDLHEAFQLSDSEVVSIVGGGGKTTILYRLAFEAVSRGRKAIVTGTTRFTPPEHGDLPAMVLAEGAPARLQGAREVLDRASLVVLGAGWGNQGRILPVEPEELGVFSRIEDVSLVVAEADGSAGRPFKAPAEHEPVIAPATTLLLSVTGLDVLGRPLDAENVHRSEIVAEITLSQLGDPVTIEMIARVLLSDRGGRKSLPRDGRWLPVLNKADAPERIEAARELAALLVAGGAARAVIATAGREPPVVEVVD